MTRHHQDAAEDSAADALKKNPDPESAETRDPEGNAGVDPATPESAPPADPASDGNGDIDGDSAEQPSREALSEQLAEAREELSELKDSALRAHAEMENVRRRAQNEVVAARKYAIEGFAQELLGVKDSLDQAARVELSSDESDAVVRMQEGLALTLKQLDAVLSKFAVNEVEAGPGVKFNPDQHQAISMVASDEFDSNHIISVMQKGFTLKDRLLRPAMVVVAS